MTDRGRLSFPPVATAMAILCATLLAPLAASAAEGGGRAGERALLSWADKSSTASLLALSPACGGGLVYDDGSFEQHYQFAGSSSVDMVMRFDLATVPAALDQACICLTRTGGDGTVDFDLLLYDAEGAGSQPGTLISGIGGLRVDSIPLWPQTAFYNLDLRGFPISVEQSRIFFGISWDTTANPDVYLCGDENGPGLQPAAVSTDLGNSWADLRGFFPKLKALGLRAEFSADTGNSFECVANETTLCLNDGRYEVKVDWKTRQGQTGDGKPVEFGSDDSGMFSFFNTSNWEMLVKVLDGCSVNQHRWVFFAAVTNVEFTLTVTDSETGESQRYFNPQGSSADAVTDTEAFANCP